MARIAGVDIPREKRLEISLTYIYGIGRTTAQQVCDESGMSRDTRVRDLTDEEVARLRGLKLKLVPGMPVESFIQTDFRTVISYLVKPMSDQIAKAFREK